MTHKTQPTAHAEITAPISADLRGIEQEAQELPEPIATAGMNLGQRILHVGGRENAAGYIEFGSVAAVRALVGQVLRDLPSQAAAKCLHRADAAHDPAIEKPEAGRYVLAWTEGAKVPIRAMWAPQFILEMAEDDAETGEYSEEKDQYFCPAGWYENNAHEETHWSVSTPVVAWMELPRRSPTLQAAPPAPAAVAVPAEVELPAREPWLLYLSDRADGVKGHYAIARWNPRGFREVWNLRRHAWSSFSDDVLTLQQAETLLQNLAIPTAPVQVTAQPSREPLTAEQIEVRQDHFAPAQEHATQLAGQGQEKCVCTFAQRVVGDGCRHCNPQEYIDRLHKCLDEYREEADAPAKAQEDARDAGGWYLQDTRSYVGNDVVWWAKDGKGYTTDVSKAHVFTQEQAFRQASMRGVDRAWPKEYIDGKTRPAVDMQYIDHDTAIAARAAQGGATT